LDSVDGVRLTKFTHSCVRLDDGDRAMVIDPGIYSQADTALDGVGAVLVTHEHVDHLDAAAVLAVAERRPDLRVWCPESVRGQLDRLGERVTVVTAGEEFTAHGFTVRAFGGQHALIHSSVPVVANLAYLVEGSVYHPGDSFTVPEVAVETLLLPVHAPWSKIAEVLDFVIGVRARRVHQIHDGLLNGRGIELLEGHVNRVAQRYGSRFQHLDSGEAVEL